MLMSAAVRAAFSGVGRPSFSIRPDRIPAGGSFSRGTLATQVNADGSVGWAPHNLVADSQNLSVFPWSAPVGTVAATPNFALAPDGSSTATRLQFAAPNTGNQYCYNFSFTAGVVTSSVWLKLQTGASAQLKLGFFDGASIQADTITVTNQWQRFSVTKVVATGPGRAVWMYPESDGWATDILAWGAQLNLGPLQPYYPTTGTAFHGLRTADYSDDPLRRGIKIEPQATNLLQRSNLSDWVFGNDALPASSISLNVAGVTAPDGTQTATRITPGVSGNSTLTLSSSNANRVFLDGSGLPNGQYTESIWIKTDAQASNVTIFVGNAAADTPKAQVTFLSTSVWTRVSVTGVTTTSPGTGFRFVICTQYSVLVWGAQCEAGPVATSYIPTAGAAVTRGADVWNYPEGAIPAQGAVGTWVAKWLTTLNDPGVRVVFSIASPSGTGAGQVYKSSLNVLTSDISNIGAPINLAVPGAGLLSAALAYSPSGRALSAFGGTPSVRSEAPTRFSGAQIGATDGQYFFSGSIYALDYYPQALPAARLQALTAP
jgi:hypothetical protein